MLKANKPSQKSVTYRGKRYTKDAAWQHISTAQYYARSMKAKKLRKGTVIVDLGASRKLRYAVFTR